MIKKSLIPHRRRSQRGLTLIELLVVLFVVAATAGIAVGILPNFQKKAHGSTSAASIRGAETAITAALLTGGELGNGFDRLNDGTAVPDYIGEGPTFGTLAATTTILDALAELGITEVYDAAYADRAAVITAGANATFDGHDYTAPTVLAATDPLTTVTGAAADVVDIYNLDSTPSQIFAFGLGEESTLVGLNKAFKEAPVHTPGEGSAATTYSRYAVLVGYDATVGEEEAFYIGITCIDDGTELKNIQGNLAEFYEND